MKLLKTHVLLIIAGVLVLGGVITLFWPLPGMAEELRTRMTNRLASGADRARSLADQTVTIPPSGPNEKAYERTHTVITPADILAKTRVLDNMVRQADETAQEHAKANQKGRVNANGVPLLGNKAFPGLLPEPPSFGTGGHEFRRAYVEYHQQLMHDLTVGPNSSVDPGDATDAPTEKDVQAAKDAEVANRRCRRRACPWAAR